jgi:hypothetical protein
LLLFSRVSGLLEERTRGVVTPEEELMRFAVDTKFVFSGKFFIEAENKKQARKYVNEHCGLVIGGNVHSTLSEEEADWEFDVHPDKVIGLIWRVS